MDLQKSQTLLRITMSDVEILFGRSPFTNWDMAL